MHASMPEPVNPTDSNHGSRRAAKGREEESVNLPGREPESGRSDTDPLAKWPAHVRTRTADRTPFGRQVRRSQRFRETRTGSGLTRKMPGFDTSSEPRTRTGGRRQSRSTRHNGQGLTDGLRFNSADMRTGIDPARWDLRGSTGINKTGLSDKRSRTQSTKCNLSCATKSAASVIRFKIRSVS